MPRSREQGERTRQRILDVALELFTDAGYDKTSLRDIAERLGITKAALYYYFARKEDILVELHMQFHDLGSAMLDFIEASPDGAARVAAWPQLVDRMLEFMVVNRNLLTLHHRNRTAFDTINADPRNVAENAALEARIERILSSPEISLRDRVRMSASIGMITEVLIEQVATFDGEPVEDVVAEIRAAIDDVIGAPTRA